MKIEIVIQANLPQLAEGLTRDIGEVAMQVVLGIEGEAKRLIQQSTPHGRVYRRGPITRPASQRLLAIGLKLSKTKPGQIIAGSKFHRASAPGEPPASDTANLVNSIRAKRTGAMSAELDINAGYAGLLEAGTARMAPRPFVFPAIDFVLEQVLPNL